MAMSKVYKLLHVTAVLTAKDDGTQALGIIKNGKVFPVEPYLRNPNKHKNPDNNYIKDWIRLANLQLLYSGAYFGLDVDNISYVFVCNTELHERECDEEDKTIYSRTTQFFENSDYRNTVIILFRWGKNPSRIAGQACSGLDSSYILMPGYYRDQYRDQPIYQDDPIYLDGQLVFGNNHLSHELGHFMGLAHPFSGDLANKIAELANRGNPKKYPLLKDNLAYMDGVTEQDLETRKQQMLNYINTWPFSLDQDCFGDRENGIPDEYSINDTPVDLSLGLPLLYGNIASRGSYDYTFKRYPSDKLKEIKNATGELIWWEPKEGAEKTVEDRVSVNDVVRRNIMNYWDWNPECKRFSADQVRRMHYVLNNQRSNLISRTIPADEYLLSVKYIATEYRRKSPPISVRKDIYGGSNPRNLTLREQLRLILNSY